MDIKKSIESIVIPDISKDQVEDLKTLFSTLYSKEEQKKIKTFIKEMLQVLNVYDFEFVKFVKNLDSNEFSCFVSKFEIFKINQAGLIIYLDPLPLSPEYKKEVISIAEKNNQSSQKLKQEYEANVALVYCDPKFISILNKEFIKGFSYLVRSLMDYSFTSLEDNHDLDFLKFFDLEFLLDLENESDISDSNSTDLQQFLKGETDSIEYKPSIFWSNEISNQKIPVESKLTNISQNEILKTINGFMNSSGGNLIVGLHDKVKETDSVKNMPRKDFQDEYYNNPDFDRYLLKITELLKHGFGSVSMQLCEIEQINLGPGDVFDDSVIPSSKKNFHEKFVKYEKDRMLLKITVKESTIPVFVNLKSESCRNHECENCTGTSSSSRFNLANNSSAYFVRSPGSSTEQYNFEKIIEHISIRYPKYFSFIYDTEENKDLQ